MHPFLIFLFTQYVYWYTKMQVWALIIAMHYKALKTRLIGAPVARYDIKCIAEDNLYEVYDSHKDRHFIFTCEPETHKIEEHIIQDPPFLSIGLKYADAEEYTTLDKWHPVLIKGNRLSRDVMEHMFKRHRGSTVVQPKPLWISILDNRFIVSEINLDDYNIVLKPDGAWESCPVRP